MSEDGEFTRMSEIVPGDLLRWNTGVWLILSATREPHGTHSIVILEGDHISEFTRLLNDMMFQKLRITE